MTRDWEETFAQWTGRASDAEQRRYERTRDQIQKAIAAERALART